MDGEKVLIAENGAICPLIEPYLSMENMTKAILLPGGEVVTEKEAKKRSKPSKAKKESASSGK